MNPPARQVTPGPRVRRSRFRLIGLGRFAPVTRALLLAVGLLLLSHPVARAASDVFSNVAPASQLSGGALADRYPLGDYALDYHFTAASASLLGGVDISGVPALIAYFLTDVIWQLTAFLASTLITLFTFAFSLDLVNGSAATGGAGALAPVSAAVRSIYSTTFGAPWLVVAIVLAGLWAMWKALVQRRYTETAGALVLSVCFCVLALAFVTQPQQTIGRASRWTNEMSAGFLSLSSTGSVTSEQAAKQHASDQLFHLLVYQPWTVLEFGGLEHCVKTPIAPSAPRSVAVRPLATNLARDTALSKQLASSGQVQADGKLCINNENKYAAHFLAYPPGSNDRNSEYDALANGDSSKLPATDPSKQSGTYHLSAADKPAADAMGKGGQYGRLLLAVVIFAGELGAFLLLGMLSIAVILAQVLVLLLLAFAPVALVIGVYPGRGHDFFRGWLARLATFLLRKAIYSLILAVLLAVAAAVSDATSDLGWLLSFGLQAAFFWAVFLYRHRLTGQLTAATTGQAAAAQDGTVRLATLYAASRLARRTLPHRRPSRPGPRPSGYDPDSTPSPEADQTGSETPRDGTERREPSPAAPTPVPTPAGPGHDSESRKTRPAAGEEGSPAAPVGASGAVTRTVTRPDGNPPQSAAAPPAQGHRRQTSSSADPPPSPIPGPRRTRGGDESREPATRPAASTPAPPSALPAQPVAPSPVPAASGRAEPAPPGPAALPPQGDIAARDTESSLADQLRHDTHVRHENPPPPPVAADQANPPDGIPDDRHARWPARPQRPERPDGER